MKRRQRLIGLAALIAATAATLGMGPPAEVSVEGDGIVVRLRGLNKVWALRSRVTVPRREVRAVSIADRPRRPPAVRLGTWLPGVITAGWFWRPGRIEFWAVHRGPRVVVIELVPGRRTRRLVLEVADPAAVVDALQPS